MELLAHRGLWQDICEKNTITSIQKAFEQGYGIETDIRDYDGSLVISHNIADKGCILLSDVLSLYKRMGMNTRLALNVKADGLQYLLKEELDKYEIENYFVFDMSIPEQVVYHRQKFTYFTRQSDIEQKCVQYEDADGIWLDSFYDDSWITQQIIKNHIKQGKRVCLVSPELHGKSYQNIWALIKENQLHMEPSFILCTDITNKAREYFS